MDIDALVMTAAARYSVHATGADTYKGPVNGAQLSAIYFASADEAAILARRCMAEGIPACAYPNDDGNAVIILH
jgi:hypothetical protein